MTCFVKFRSVLFITLLAIPLQGCDLIFHKNKHGDTHGVSSTNDSEEGPEAAQNRPGFMKLADVQPTSIDELQARKDISVDHRDTKAKGGVRPSFDCSARLSDIERIICSDDDLARADRLLAETYHQATQGQSASDRHHILSSQRAFLRSRNICKTVQCIKDAYREQQQVLAHWSDGAAGDRSLNQPSECKIANIEDHVGVSSTKVDRFLQQLQQAVRDGDWKAVANSVHYPIGIGPKSDTRIYHNANELVANSAAIFTRPVRDAILQQRCDDIFTNWQGAMIGNGQVWLNDFGGRLQIMSINIDAPKVK